MSERGLAILGVVLMILGGCSHSQSPVLYPNAKLEQVGKAQADADIATCRQRADDYVSSGGATAKEVGKDTAVGGGAGAAVGGAAAREGERPSGPPQGRPRAPSTERSRARDPAPSTRTSSTDACARRATRSSAGSSYFASGRPTDFLIFAIWPAWSFQW